METGKIKGISKFSIALGFVGQALLTGLVAGYVTYFGTDIVGISALAMGNILLVSRIFDGVTDILMGVVIDRTKSKQGKARPWIIRSIIPFILFTILLVFVYLGLYTRLAVMIYYGLYVLGNPGLVAVLVIADNVPGLIAMPFALAVSNKIGKRKAALGGLLLTMIGFAIMLLNIYNIPVFVAGLVIKGIFFAPVQGSTNAFVADSALYGEWKTGVKSEGMAYSAISFANKASSGLSGVVVGWVLALTGYVGGAATQTPSAVNGIIFLYIGVTLICTIGQIIVFAFYNLDSKMPQIRKELNERD